MIVGGEPINADPPMRAMELMYTPGEKDWASVITVNSRDWGPLLHEGSSDLVPSESRSLFCQKFVERSLKWRVCPRDLRDLVQAVDSANEDEGGEDKTLEKLLQETGIGGVGEDFDEVFEKVGLDEERSDEL